MTAAPQPKDASPAIDPGTAASWGATAMAAMAKHNVPPLPENYLVFFMYASGMHPDLTQEIDNAVAQRMPLMPHVMKNLYNRFGVPSRNERVINDMTQGANRLLGEVLRVVGDFSKETSSYSNDIDTYMGKISVDIEDHSLQGLVKDILSATVAMKQKGDQLNNKLTESRSEIESLKKGMDQLTQESQRDFLTGVYNRKALDHMLEEQIAMQQTQGGELSLLMLDVDHFKAFNDKYGHLLGDEVLKIVARALTYCIRGKDTAARYGGEEFCVLLPGTPLAGAVKVAENIRATIATRDLKRKDTGESFGNITVSVGVAQLRGRDNVESFIKRADEALYKAKHNGRNRVAAEGE